MRIYVFISIVLAGLVFPLESTALRSFTSALHKKNVIPLVILGAGPAGLTAALYGRRLGYPTTVFTGPTPGGQLTETHLVENYPGVKKVPGADLMQNLQDQVEEAGAVILQDTIIEANFDSWPFLLKAESGLEVHALSVVIATGAAPRRLGVPGELVYWGKGVSPCSICDGIFFKGKNVVVVGGGDTAIEEASHLAPHAKQVTVLVRSDRMRATPVMRDALRNYENVKVIFNKQVTHILGDGQSVTGVMLLNTDTQKTEVFKTDGVFLAIGRNPNTELFKNHIRLTKKGYIFCDGRTQATSVPGVYAAGDVEDEEFRQAIVAAGRGCQAVFEAVSYLKEVGLNEPEVKRSMSSFFDSKRYLENLN